MTPPAFLLHFPPVPAMPATLALIILCLALVFTVAVVLLVASALSIAPALRSFDKTKSATRGGSKNVSVKTALVFCAT